MSERSEFRSRREERTENGVKNPIGSEAISQNFCLEPGIHYHESWNASRLYPKQGDQEGYSQTDKDNDRYPGNDVVSAPIDVDSHQLFIIDQNEHEDQN